MNIFLAGTFTYFKVIEKIKPIFILESFFILKKSKKITEKFIEFIHKEIGIDNFLLDSGAFTFIGTLKNEKIDFEGYVNEYADFINKHNIKYFFELDVDGVVGLKEVERLRSILENKTGKQSIPVWHKSRGKENFLKMIEDYKYVAIGVSGKNDSKWSISNPKIINYFISEAHKKGCRIHGLGFTRLKVLENYPFDSVDSTSWLSGGRFGAIHQFKDGDLEVKAKSISEKRRIKSTEIDEHNLKQWILFQKYMGGIK
jgi:hypothetical protein